MLARRAVLAFGVLSTVFLSSLELRAQVVNPADAQRPPPAGSPAGASGAPADAPAAPGAPARAATHEGSPFEHLRSFELPAVTVVGEAAPTLREEERVGSYGQPRWTATRRFPGTRVYVVPEGKVEFEYWLRPTIERHGPDKIRQLFELEFGLPHRLQLDLYLRLDQEGDRSPWQLGQQLEIRWALADWGKLPGNPALYFEWVGLEERPDKIEPKLLFGGELAPRWHWGLNLVGELELGGEREYEYSATGGLSYSVIDARLSLGIESIVSLIDVQGDRGNFGQSEEVFVGPSLQYRPLPQFTLNFAPLFGVTDSSPRAKIFINFGCEF